MSDVGQAWTAVNETRLVGTVSGEVVPRELPSGDVLLALRVVVPRPAEEVAATRAQGRRAVTVDTLDVVCWEGPARDVASVLAAGDVVEVRGPLRRRFYRAGPAAVSRCEVRADALAVVRLVEETEASPTTAAGEETPASTAARGPVLPEEGPGQ